MNPAATALYEKLKSIKVGNPLCQFTPQKCDALVPIITRINTLKKEQNAVILAHSYLPPEITYGVADVVGDSLALAMSAQKTQADTIVFAAVDFMADTAKILNPNKRVLRPNRNGGCSLAESMSGTDVKRLREQHPEFTFVCYINTTAEVKAECDVTVTSSNVATVIERLPNDRIFFLPDKLMAQNILRHLKDKGIQKTLLWSEGTCYVHEEYDGAQLPMMRRQYHDLEVLAHPECRPEVASQANFVGSTNQIIDEVKRSHHKNYLILSECGLVARLEAECPEKTFLGTCMMCKYMKGNTLEDILRVLERPNPRDEIILEESIRLRAQKTLDKMFELSKS